MLSGRGIDSQVTFGYSQSHVVGVRDITSRIFTIFIHHGRGRSSGLVIWHSPRRSKTQIPDCKVEANG